MIENDIIRLGAAENVLRALEGYLLMEDLDCADDPACGRCRTCLLATALEVWRRVDGNEQAPRPREHRRRFDRDTCWACGDYWPCVTYTDSLGI